jgi:hypothetical protein
VTVLVVAGVLVGLPALAARARRGEGASVMGPFEEMWHPAARRARLEVEVPPGPAQRAQVEMAPRQLVGVDPAGEEHVPTVFRTARRRGSGTLTPQAGARRLSVWSCPI